MLTQINVGCGDCARRRSGTPCLSFRGDARQRLLLSDAGNQAAERLMTTNGQPLR